MVRLTFCAILIKTACNRNVRKNIGLSVKDNNTIKNKEGRQKQMQNTDTH